MTEFDRAAKAWQQPVKILGAMTVEVVRVYCEVGDDTEGNPKRKVSRYYTTAGNFLFCESEDRLIGPMTNQGEV